MKKIPTETIIRTFNEVRNVAKAAEILGMNHRVLQRRIKAECDWQLKPK